MSHRAVLAFVDNDPAKHALVRGSSAVRDVAALVDAICSLETRSRMLTYVERVPSASNPADAPSRGEAPVQLDMLGRAARVSVDCDAVKMGWAPGRELPGLLCRGVRDLKLL